MKTPFHASPSNRTGFTLVELLVVIAIIAILAAAVVAGAGGAINAAKRTKANNSATQIQTAITSYYTEYGVYPLETSTAGNPQDVIYTTANQQQDLMYALCGNINVAQPTTALNKPDQVSNTRNIAFMTPKRSDVDNEGIMINPFSTTASPYYFSIAMDGDYDGILGDTGGVAQQMPDFINWTASSNSAPKYLQNGLTQGVAVWACCDPQYISKPQGSRSPQFWVHTY